MNYFMDRENVNKYKEMLSDYDGRLLFDKLAEFVHDGDKVLELGMGAGLDLEKLNEKYDVIGSDNSPVFIQDFNAKNTGIKIIEIDAISIDIDQTFDCIFSNKVLQHLTREQFEQSLISQKKHLNEQGIIFTTLWYGKHEEELMFDGQLRFTYYTENDIIEIIGDDFEILTIERYCESEEFDSILAVLKNKSL